MNSRMIKKCGFLAETTVTKAIYVGSSRRIHMIKPIKPKSRKQLN